MAIELPDWTWQKPETRLALQARDVGAVFRLVQQYGGHSQGKIAAAVDMTQSRVNEIINGRRTVKELDVFERVADGLAMPDDARHLLGLASISRVRGDGRAFDLAAFPEVVRVYSAQAAAASEIQRQARQAAEIDVLAVRGLGLLGLNDSLLRNCLAREDGPRARVRVMLLDPDCDAVTVRADEIGESPDSLAAGIRLAEFRMRELSDVCDIEVYWYRLIPTWRVVRVDETVYVSAFDVGWEGHESATYKVMETPYGPLYRGFRRMFDALVGDAVRTV